MNKDMRPSFSRQARRLVLLGIAFSTVALAIWILFAWVNTPSRSPTEHQTRAESTPIVPAAPARETDELVREAVRDEQSDTHGSLVVATQYDDGTKAVGIGLTLQLPDTGARIAAQRARTDAEGNCLFTRVAPGTWWLRSDLADAGSTASVVVHAGEPTHHRLVLPVALRVRGHVLDQDGVAVAGAVIILAPPTTFDHDPREVAVTDVFGAFALVSGMTPSLIGARAAGHAPSPLQVLEGRTGSVVEGVVLRLSKQAGAIRGQLRGPDGKPVEAATVRVGDGRLLTAKDTAPPVQAQVESDENGVFVVEGVATGSHAVAVRKLGLATWHGSCEVAVGQTTTLDVRLLDGGRVVGVVRKPDGQPIGEVIVTTGGAGDLAFTQMVTLADGAYGFEDLAPGEHVVMARHREYGVTFVEVHCEDGREVVQDIELKPGNVVHGRVLLMDGTPTHAHVRASQEEPKSWGWDGFARQSDGRFWIAGAPEGLVNIVVSGRELVERQFRRIDPAKGEVELRVELKPEPTARIRGTVLKPDGQPVFFGDVAAMATNGPYRKVRATSNKVLPPNGTFELGPIPPDTYEVQIDCSGFPKYFSERRTLAPHEHWDLGIVQLESPGWIRTTFPAGQPDNLRVEVWGDRREWLGDISSSGLSPPLSAGRYVLRVSAPGHGEFGRAVELARGETVEVELAMSQGFSCRLELRRTDARRWQRMFVEVGRAGEAGSYRPRVFPELETVYVDERTLRSGPHEVRVEIEGRTIVTPIVVETREDVQVFSIAIDG